MSAVGVVVAVVVVVDVVVVVVVVVVAVVVLLSRGKQEGRRGKGVGAPLRHGALYIRLAGSGWVIIQVAHLTRRGSAQAQ